MIRPVIFLLLLLVASIGMQDIATAQGPDAATLRRMKAGMGGDVSNEPKKTKYPITDEDKDGDGYADEDDEPRSKGSAKKAQPSAASKGSDKKDGSDKKEDSMAKTPSFELFTSKPVSLMAVLDIDGDGQLSGSEIDYATDQLLRLDANDNGQIEPEELPDAAPMFSGFDPAYAGPGKDVYMTISGFDKNADGLLTRSEMKSQYRSVFRTIDSDGNKSISPKELMGYVKKQ